MKIFLSLDKRTVSSHKIETFTSKWNKLFVIFALHSSQKSQGPSVRLSIEK